MYWKALLVKSCWMKRSMLYLEAKLCHTQKHGWVPREYKQMHWNSKVIVGLRFSIIFLYLFALWFDYRCITEVEYSYNAKIKKMQKQVWIYNMVPTQWQWVLKPLRFLLLGCIVEQEKAMQVSTIPLVLHPKTLIRAIGKVECSFPEHYPAVQW